MLFLGFFTVLLFLSFIFPKSKKITIVILCYISLIFSFGQYKGDFVVYRWVYQEFSSGIAYTSYEPGYVALLWIATKLRIPFVVFRLACATFICSSLYGVVKRQTVYTAIAVALYSLFPFFIYTAIFRTGIASAFVVLAIEKMAENKKKCFIFFIILAALFHYSSLVFLLLLMLRKGTKNKQILAVFVMGMVLSVLINYSSVAYDIIARFTSSAKVLQWFKRNNSSANFNGILAEILLLLMLYYLSYRSLKKRGIQFINWGDEYNNSYGLEVLTYKLSLFMFLILPLMIYASPFMRIPYMVLIFFIIVSLNNKEIVNDNVNCLNNIGVVPSGWFFLLFVVIAWKVYYDLPYLKEGTSVFWEYLEVTF